jgi:Tfp pilus assembly protein PilX
MSKSFFQSGITLVVSLIMLVVLTLLVVSAIRFGNINLKIAGNSQVQTEAAAAAQVAVEQTIKSAVAGTSLSSMPATTTTVSTGAVSYSVAVAKPICNTTVNIDPTSLDPTNASDRPCFGAGDTDKLVDSTGKLTTAPTECKSQQWDVSASVGDGSSGASVTILQGASLRVGAQVSCP